MTLLRRTDFGPCVPNYSIVWTSDNVVIESGFHVELATSPGQPNCSPRSRFGARSCSEAAGRPRSVARTAIEVLRVHIGHAIHVPASCTELPARSSCPRTRRRRGFAPSSWPSINGRATARDRGLKALAAFTTHINTLMFHAPCFSSAILTDLNHRTLPHLVQSSKFRARSKVKLRFELPKCPRHVKAAMLPRHLYPIQTTSPTLKKCSMPSRSLYQQVHPPLSRQRRTQPSG